MLTYKLYGMQTMLLSETSRMSQPDADLHPVQNQDHAFIRNKQKGQLDADLQPVQNPDHAFVSNKQKGPARC